LSLAGAAATCGLSRSYFSKAFKATTGRSPHRWLIEYRIQQSRQKLRGPGTIADIALECGFTDQSHFTRVFTQLVGVPPGLWRRRC
jgi:AraC-like DNA-binding protein